MKMLPTLIFISIKPYLSREKGSRFEILKVDGDDESTKEEDEAEQVDIRVVVHTLRASSFHGTIVKLQV